MTADRTPTFSELSSDECRALLSRNQVGRLAFTFHDRVDIEPITYAFAEDWIVGRTSPGAKLTTVRHHPWVAFEVDEVKGRYDWQSVVVHGALDILAPDASAKDRAAYDEIVTVIRAGEPDALRPRDPVPHRTVVFRIHVDEVTGRRGATRG